MYLNFLFNLPSNILIASGAYDNGTATGKGNLSLDLTWNPFNYFQEGQSYIVLGYGISNKLDVHGYYSIPVNKSDNYYFGLFYQFFGNTNVDLATAIGIRRYILKRDIHLFFPQFLYTIYTFNNFRFGGSIVNILDIRNRYKSIGSTIDIGFIIPIIKSKNKKNKIKSLDLTIGVFRPTLWRPDKGNWHPTYSIDMKFVP